MSYVLRWKIPGRTTYWAPSVDPFWTEDRSKAERFETLHWAYVRMSELHEDYLPVVRIVRIKKVPRKNPLQARVDYLERTLRELVMSDYHCKTEMLKEYGLL